MAIWAATAVTAAINAARVMVDALKADLSAKEVIAPTIAEPNGPLLPPFVPGFRRQSYLEAFDPGTFG